MCKSIVSVTVLISHPGHHRLEGWREHSCYQLCFLGFYSAIGGNFCVVIMVSHATFLSYVSILCTQAACGLLVLANLSMEVNCSSCGFPLKMYIVFQKFFKRCFKGFFFFFHKCNPGCPRISKYFPPLSRLQQARVRV